MFRFVTRRPTQRFPASLVAAALMMLPLPALAESPQPLGTFRDWNAYSFTEGSKKTCFAASAPVDSEPKGARRGDIHLIVTNRPADKVAGEISIAAGYEFKEGAKATLEVDGKSYDLTTKGENAWTASPDVDKTVTQAMIKANDLAVRGMSARNTRTTDRFSLNGFKAAYDAIAKACR